MDVKKAHNSCVFHSKLFQHWLLYLRPQIPMQLSIKHYWRLGMHVNTKWLCLVSDFMVIFSRSENSWVTLIYYILPVGQFCGWSLALLSYLDHILLVNVKQLINYKCVNMYPYAYETDCSFFLCVYIILLLIYMYFKYLFDFWLSLASDFEYIFTDHL